jgi:hypothetical protein
LTFEEWFDIIRRMVDRNELSQFLKPQEVSGAELIQLPELLRLVNRGEVIFYPVALSDIQAKMREEFQAQLPEDLVSQFGFGGLDWRFVIPFSAFYGSEGLVVPQLFLGFKSGKPTAVEDALGTIELKRMVNEEGRLSQITDVRVAGVALDSGRMLRTMGATYSPWTLNAHRFDVSVSDLEVPKPRTRGDSLETFQYQCQYQWTTQSIPTAPSEPYWTAALITQKMVEETEHNKVFRMHDSTEEGFSIMAGDRELAKKLGFTVSSTGDEHILSYNSPAGEPWSLSIPQKLQPVTE